jgi:NADPH:quinone reductase-like Zn-dependent oxidoreductase
MGVCVSYGEVSGACPAIDLNHLLFNSLYITRPVLALYKAARIELVLAANEVFKNVEQGVIRPSVTNYSFSDLPLAHRDLEERKSKGSLVVNLS